MTPDPHTGGRAQRAAANRRAAMLVRLKAQSETDGKRCLPMLIDGCMNDPALLSLHVWHVEQAVFDSPRHTALKHIEQAAVWSGAPCPHPATATMGWLLDARTKGARWSAWMLAVALGLGFRLGHPDPWR